jgi:phenylacetate-CoA ligase
MNTAILNLPISVVHLPIAEEDSVENKVHFLEIYEATVLLATFSTARNIAQNLRERGKTLPKLRLVLYSGACFSADQTPVPRSAFPNAIVCPSEFGSMSAGLLGIPAQPFRREDGPNPVYKVLEPLVVVEIVKDNGQPITTSGVKGNMVVTHLVRRLQPMLRFPIGVTASWVNYGLETFRVHED